MSLIEENHYGVIAVNNKVLIKMIVEEILKLSDFVIPCDKKGKVIKDKPAPFIDSDLLDSVTITDKKRVVIVSVYCIVKAGNSISDVSDVLFNIVYNVFSLFRLNRPERVDIKIKGVMSDCLQKKNIEVSRKND